MHLNERRTAADAAGDNAGDTAGAAAASAALCRTACAIGRWGAPHIQPICVAPFLTHFNFISSAVLLLLTDSVLVSVTHCRNTHFSC